MEENQNSYRYSHKGENYGKSYQDHYSRDNYNTRVWELEKEILDKILGKYFGSQKVPSYMDFACGTGRVCSFLENRAKECIGIDVSESMMKIARQRCQKTVIINGDITKDNFLGDKKFDLITAFRFFLNAEDGLRKEVLKNIKTLLKKDGILVFNIHGNKNSLRHIQVILSGRGNEISPNEIRKLLGECGFSIQEIVGVSFLYEKLSFLPRRWWFLLEKIIQKISFLNEVAINFIVVAKINEEV